MQWYIRCFSLQSLKYSLEEFGTTRVHMPRGVGGKGQANIMRHLRGLHFPVSKQDILEHVAEKQSEQGYKDTAVVLEYMQRLPQATYSSVSHILHQLKEGK